MEAVQVAAGRLELLDPFLGLVVGKKRQILLTNRGGKDNYFGNHHVAVKRPLPMGLGWFVDMGADLDHDRGSKGDIGHEMPIPGASVSMYFFFGGMKDANHT